LVTLAIAWITGEELLRTRSAALSSARCAAATAARATSAIHVIDRVHAL
jgi:hypothetical protein